MTIKEIKIGAKLTHTAMNYEGRVQPVIVRRFDRQAIEVESTVTGNRFWCNAWELSK